MTMGMTSPDRASRQTADTDDITRADTARAAEPSQVMKRKKSGIDDIANPESKQEIAAQPYNSEKNA